MKIKTSELTGAALDWAVAKCEGRLPASYDDWPQKWPRYSTDWSQGGPIIEREGICTDKMLNGSWLAVKRGASVDGDSRMVGGPTTLIAAMRCIVASKMGDEVDVPEELT